MTRPIGKRAERAQRPRADADLPRLAAERSSHALLQLLQGRAFTGREKRLANCLRTRGKQEKQVGDVLDVYHRERPGPTGYRQLQPVPHQLEEKEIFPVARAENATGPDDGEVDRARERGGDSLRLRLALAVPVLGLERILLTARTRQR